MAKSLFAKSVKEEIAQHEYTKEEMKYILSGFARNGALFSVGAVPSLTLKTKLAATAKLLYNCLKTCYDLSPSFVYEKTSKFGQGLIYLVTVSDEKLYDVMEDLEIFTDGGFTRIPPKEGIRTKNIQYLVIGSFLANGSINNPSSSKTSYFAEMAFTSKEDAMAIKHKLNSFKNEKTMDFKYIKRREKDVLYLKKSDQIAVFLLMIGATQAMFDFENARLEKEDINNSNRLSICDSANYAKTVKSAQRDIEAINYLLKFKPISLFDTKTQAVINARLKFSELNYREIAAYINDENNIAITKSGVVHILTSLREEAEKYKRNQNK